MTAVFSRKAIFDRRYVKVVVYEPCDHDEASIIVGQYDGNEYHNIGLTRAEAIKLRDILVAAIDVDTATFLRRVETCVETNGEEWR